MNKPTKKPVDSILLIAALLFWYLSKLPTQEYLFNSLRFQCLLFLLVSSISLVAQDEVLTVTFSTTENTLLVGENKKIPFDEPFRIKITDTSIASIGLKYKIKGHCNDIGTGYDAQECKKKYKKRHYRLKGSKSDPEGYVNLGNARPSTIGNFYISMDPLHHNANYDLIFTAKKKLLVEDTQRTQLRNTIAELINATYDYKRASYDGADLDKMYDKIGKVIKKTTGKNKLYDKGDKELDLSLGKITFEEVEEYEDSVRAKHLKLIKLNDKLCGNKIGDVGKIKGIIAAYIAAKPKIDVALDSIFKYKRYESFLKQTANSVIDQSSTNQQILSILNQDRSRGELKIDDFTNKDICECKTYNHYLPQLLGGQAKLNGNLVESFTTFDIKSGRLLLSAIINLTQLFDASGNPFLPDLQINKTLINEFANWINTVHSYNLTLADLANKTSLFPEILEEVYTSWTTEADIFLNAPIDTKETPYIGADLGLLIAPRIGSVFIFEGFNLHARPVNRRAKSSNLQGCDKFLKHVSLTVGLAQRLGTPDEVFEHSLGKNALLVGGGIRVLRFVRINAGGLWYKVKNEIPTITKKNSKITPVLGLSIDVSLKEAFGLVGQLFK